LVIMLATLRRLWRHHWMDESDTRRLVPPDALERLRRRDAYRALDEPLRVPDLPAWPEPGDRLR